ncbi:MAG: dynamin family protein [Myxococcota bacterium]|nr:dynamin family protein [Myxococcota bacterium]
MSLFNRIGRVAQRVGDKLQTQVEGIVQDSLLPEAVRAALVEAEKLLERGDWLGAEQSLQRAEQQKPGLARVAHLRGLLALRTGKAEWAAHHFEQALRQRASVEGYYHLGLACEQLQRLDEARHALLSALHSEREHALRVDALHALGRVSTAMGQHERAAQHWRRALAMRPAEPLLRELTAGALQRTERSEEAAQLLAALPQADFVLSTWVLLADLEESQGRLEAAAQALSRAISCAQEKRSATRPSYPFVELPSRSLLHSLHAWAVSLDWRRGQWQQALERSERWGAGAFESEDWALSSSVMAARKALLQGEASAAAAALARHTVEPSKLGPRAYFDWISTKAWVALANANAEAAVELYEKLLDREERKLSSRLGRTAFEGRARPKADEGHRSTGENAPEHERTPANANEGASSSTQARVGWGLESERRRKLSVEWAEALQGVVAARLALDQPAQAARALAQANREGVQNERLKAQLAWQLGDPFLALSSVQRARKRLEAQTDLAAATSPTPPPWAVGDALWRSYEEARLNQLQRAIEAILPQPFEAAQHPFALRELIERLREHCLLAPTLEGLSVALGDLLESAQAPLQVYVLGEFNAGKSTLINAILGESLVATGILPMTAVPCVLRYGPQPLARVVLGPGEALTGTTAQEGDEHKRFDEAAAAELDQLLERWGHRVQWAELHYPHPLLRVLHLVDTPGFNSLQDAHEERSAALLRPERAGQVGGTGQAPNLQEGFERRYGLGHADAVLWLFDASQALSSSQQAILRQVSAGPSQTFVLLNKIDVLEAQELQELCDWLRPRLREASHTLTPISALEALRVRMAARREGREASAEELASTGWEALQSVLDRGLAQRASELKAAELRRQLGRLIDEVLSELGQTQRRIEQFESEMIQGESALRTALASALVACDEREARVQRRLQELLVREARSLPEWRRPSRSWLAPLSMDEHDLTAFLERLGDAVMSLLGEEGQSLLQEIEGTMDSTVHSLERASSMLGTAAGSSTELGGLAPRVSPGLVSGASAKRPISRNFDAGPFVADFYRDQAHAEQRLRQALWERQRAWLSGRLSAVASEPRLAEVLGSEASDEQRCVRLLGTLIEPERLLSELGWREWVEEYFDAALRLCDNVRRELERSRCRLQRWIELPLAGLASTQNASKPELTG